MARFSIFSIFKHFFNEWCKKSKSDFQFFLGFLIINQSLTCQGSFKKRIGSLSCLVQQQWPFENWSKCRNKFMKNSANLNKNPHNLVCIDQNCVRFWISRFQSMVIKLPKFILTTKFQNFWPCPCGSPLCNALIIVWFSTRKWEFQNFSTLNWVFSSIQITVLPS